MKIHITQTVTGIIILHNIIKYVTCLIIVTWLQKGNIYVICVTFSLFGGGGAWLNADARKPYENKFRE